MAMFPEGKSHETPHPIEFKPGFALMYLAIREAGIPIKFQTFSINYTRQANYRGKFVGVFSEPFDFPKSFESMDKFEAVDLMKKETTRIMSNNLMLLDTNKENHRVYMA